ncbi:transglycosylase [Arthrobacter sp. GMC3]|uniref:coiled-coil domain-containing protein n=1 Tax=Arthrobacter sp. GMC3 TaxID=2058894 RepID=UPI000CE45A54|nr:transglycosylase [Arthrobacter sp. GMC3]
MTTLSRYALRAAAAAVAVGFVVISGPGASPVLADDGPPKGFPSWSDVQSAKGNVAATQAQVAKINGLLDGLENQAGLLGNAAVAAGASYALTERQLDAVTAQVDVLSAQAERAAKEGAKYRQEAVAVAVQSYKSGGTNLGVLASISALGSQESLDGLDLLHIVGAQAAAKQTKAESAQAVASALTKSLQAAQGERNRLAAEAKTGLDTAVAAQTAVTQQVASTAEQSNTLVAQLASLNNTTAEVENQYRQGQTALAAYNVAQAAKEKAAADEAARRKAEQDQAAAPNPVPNPGTPTIPNPGGGTTTPPDVVLPVIPGGAVNDPAGAQAYAAGRLGAYGWDQGQFSCLVQLWNRESNWLTTATNPYSGAYGIAQSLPAEKYATAGSDWLTNYRTQIEWGLGYIKNRYSSPCGAWAHSEAVGWY